MGILAATLINAALPGPVPEENIEICYTYIKNGQKTYKEYAFVVVARHFMQ